MIDSMIRLEHALRPFISKLPVSARQRGHAFPSHTRIEMRALVSRQHITITSKVTMVRLAESSPAGWLATWLWCR
jgi:hypothetical protein